MIIIRFGYKIPLISVLMILRNRREFYGFTLLRVIGYIWIYRTVNRIHEVFFFFFTRIKNVGRIEHIFKTLENHDTWPLPTQYYGPPLLVLKKINARLSRRLNNITIRISLNFSRTNTRPLHVF